MTMWRPGALPDDVPRYVAIADALADDVHGGLLKPGDRLPTHRELAESLGVTVGTVTRAYAEAERRGLTVGEVGRGTFVRRADEPVEHGWSSGDDAEAASGPLDLSICTPVELPGAAEARALAATLEAIAADRDSAELLRFQPGTATTKQRLAGARWIEAAGLAVQADDVLVTVGVQHALTVVLATLLRPGDVLACADLTYPGLKGVARMLGLRLRGIGLDEGGLLPDALEAACRQEPAPAAVYVVPAMQNPTGATMTERRRRAVADVAGRHDLLVVEDDIHGLLSPSPVPALANHARDRTVYMTSLDKTVSMGLRTGYMVAPADMTERLRSGIRSTVWMAPPLVSELAARWILEGTAERLLRDKRDEVAARQDLVRQALPGATLVGDRHAYHAWLHLPEPWRSDEVVAQARQRGVLVAGAEAFAVGRREVPHAVRIAVGKVASRDELRRASTILGEILDGAVEPCMDVL